MFCSTHLALLYTHPGLLYTHPDLLYTQPGLLYTHPGLLYTHPALLYTCPGLLYTHPGLLYTHPGLLPGLLYTHPGLLYTHPGLLYTHPGLLPGLLYTHPGLLYTHPDLLYTHPGLLYTHPGLLPGLLYTHPDLLYTHPGEFGVVYKAHILSDKTDQQVVALKTLKGLFTMRDLHNMMSEILKMQDFNHPHVMTLMGMSFDAANTPSMVMPYMANGSLLSYLKMNRPLLLVADTADVKKLHASEKLLTRICCQVAQGMEYLSAQKFVHRDLAARNCMIDADGVIKVGDFGLSEDVYISGYFRLDKESRGVKLPFKWLAPESIQDGLFSEKTDVWSFGVTCWEVFTVGSVPYPGLDPCDLPTFLRNGRRLEKPQNAACSETMYSLMLRCWDSDPEDRPTFAKIAITISKALQIMSDYLDLSMIGNKMQCTQNGNQEPAIANTTVQQMSTRVAAGNEPETTIQATVCEAYAEMSQRDDYQAIVTKIIALDGTEAQEMMPLEGPSSLSPRYVDDILASGGINNPPGVLHRMDLMLCQCRMWTPPTIVIVSWDLPTHSNGILINFSSYCNGALAGVLPLTVISYNSIGLLPFTLYMYMSSSHAHRHCTPHEEDSPPGGPPDPESDTNDIVISVFMNKIINPDKSFGSSNPCASFYNSLSASGAYCPNIHDSNKYCCLCWP
ncbi:hypothetical protein EMCRGX_G025984 [Ephydatia muelleri]